ncbi:MAG: four helix bundle protein [Bacteroidetes bacterium HGW-Bacteroidetes-6]|jgi:four helix bundle protein|nr:MAG: four helix bundle protein [Bacteroidetes bacterium HGW-Bacteroidetes-6]
MRNDKDNLIVKKVVDFGSQVLDLSQRMEDKHQYVIARQICKSGTSIGANVWEAQNAESIADFIHKLKIAAKEADETAFWFAICKKNEKYEYSEELDNELLEISKLLSKIIVSSKRKLQGK